MSPNSFATLPMDQLVTSGTNPAADWLWHGYLARGNITLLTSLWKAGKTTLVAGLLRRLGDGGEFLGRACRPARAVVVTEESAEMWAERLATMPVGPHARLMPRPFVFRPTVERWAALIDHALELRAAGDLDLLVVDPLASFLPGRSESDAAALLDLLQPLQRLAAEGVAVLVLHHPRKKKSDDGSTARGSGALLGFVDVILELHRFGRLESDERRRRLIGLSRHAATPRQVVYQWDPATGEFTTTGDVYLDRFRDNWKQVRTILAGRTSAATCQELLADWPADREPPGAGVLYDWLNRAFAAKLIRRQGTGRRRSPYRYRLPNRDDEYYDRGELPPICDEELPPLPGPDLPPCTDEELRREAEEVWKRVGGGKPWRRKRKKAKDGE